MSTRSATGLAVAVIALVLASACGTGNPVGSGSSPATSSTVTAAAIPTVGKPINPGPYLTNPCQLLTPTQLASIGFTITGAPSPQTDSTGPQCSWSDTKNHNHLGAIWLVHDTHGLGDIYAHRSSKGYFEPTAISDYPAVFSAAEDDRSMGACTINVAVSAHLVLLVQFVAVDNAQIPHACGITKNAAQAALSTLTGR